MREKRNSNQAKFGEATKVIRLPKSLANFLQQYPSVVSELVSQIKDGSLNLSIDVTACNTVTDNQGYDFESKINEAIAKQLDDRDRVINIAINALRESIEAIAAKPNSEATAPANFTQALLQKAKEVAPLMLQKAS